MATHAARIRSWCTLPTPGELSLSPSVPCGASAGNVASNRQHVAFITGSVAAVPRYKHYGGRYDTGKGIRDLWVPVIFEQLIF